MGDGRTPTLRDLARHLGLGKSTVQRALSGAARVAPETRQRVESAAKELGFERSMLFSILSSQRRVAGGQSLLVHYLRQDLWQSQASPASTGVDLLSFLRAEQNQVGIDVQAVEPALYAHPDRLLKILYQRGSCGLILGHCKPETYAAVRRFSKLPVLNCHQQTGGRFHTLSFNHLKGILLCWEKLWEKGYRRIGLALLRHTPVIDDDLRREMSIISLRENYGPVVDEVPPLLAPVRSDEPYLAWLRQHKPEAVITFRSGHWFLHQDAGFQHIPYVTLHAGSSPDILHIPGVEERMSLLARETLRKMDDMIRHAETGEPASPLEIRIPPVWHEGSGIPSRI